MKNPVVCHDFDDQPLSAFREGFIADHTLLLCGQEPSDVTVWAYASDAYLDDWRIIGTRQGDDSGPAVYLEGPNKARVTVRWSVTWCEEPIDALYLQDVLGEVHCVLVKHFPSHNLNMSSPVALGRHGMAACWCKDDIKVPPAPPDILKLLKEMGPQGRHEIFTLPGLETIPALYEYDMVLAYLWCCKGLPYGAVTRTTQKPDRSPDKLRAVFAAPQREPGWQGWPHIGLLPVKVEGKWQYPLGGAGWIDFREYDLAVSKGWDVYTGEFLCWPEHGALDRWSDGMQAALRQYEPGSLGYRIIRRVALQAIGSLHRTTFNRSRTLPYARRAELPRSCPSLRLSDDEAWYHWGEEKPILGREAIYMHPEWTSSVWARCRARIAQAALSVPREELVAIRQDAIYTTTPQARLEGGDRVGSFRLKDYVPGSLKAPRTLEELAALTRRVG